MPSSRPALKLPGVPGDVREVVFTRFYVLKNAAELLLKRGPPRNAGSRAFAGHLRRPGA